VTGSLRSLDPFRHQFLMNIKNASAWAVLLALATSLSFPLVIQPGRSLVEDRNRDGRADVWRYFDRDGELIRVLRDRNFDGYVDTRETFDSNRVVSRAVDQNFDRRFDPVLTTRVSTIDDVTYDVIAQPFLLPRASFVDQSLMVDRALPARDTPPDCSASSVRPGRAPPAAL